MQVPSGEAGLKTCTSCKQEKKLASFHKSRDDVGGVTNRCKACKKAYSKKWYKKNVERVKESRDTYYERNKERLKALMRERYAKRKETYAKEKD